PLVLIVQEGGNQRILGGKPAIQAGLRHSGLLDDRVDADRANSRAIEQLACRREYFLACRRLWRRVALGHGRFHPSTPVDVGLDSDTDLYVSCQTIQTCLYRARRNLPNRARQWANLL